jgi:hypothetical protein
MSISWNARACAAPLLVALLLTGACGKSSNGSPTTPTTPNTPQANRAPQVTSATVTPASGITTLTTHVFSASATDPDGDALSYTWDFGNGTSAATAGASVVYNNANTTTYQAVLTVTDGKGGTVTSTVPITSAALAGTFTGTLIGAPLSVTLTQYLGGLVSGSWEIPSLGFVGEVGPAGEPGTIDANGRFELRFKVRVGSFVDFYYRGTMDNTGQTLTGTLHGSGFSGEVLILSKSK